MHNGRMWDESGSVWIVRFRAHLGREGHQCKRVQNESPAGTPGYGLGYQEHNLHFSRGGYVHLLWAGPALWNMKNSCFDVPLSSVYKL